MDIFKGFEDFPQKDEEGIYWVWTEDQKKKLEDRGKNVRLFKQDNLRLGVQHEKVSIKPHATTPVDKSPRVKFNVSEARRDNTRPQESVMRVRPESPTSMSSSEASNKDLKRERNRSLSRQRGLTTMSEKERRMFAAHLEALRLASEVKKH